MLTMHHIICDSWTIERLVAELLTIYQARCAGRPPALPALTLQYADFALWERQCLGPEVLQPQLDYWRRQLADVPERLELPTDRPRPAQPSFCGGNYYFALPAALAEALQRLGQEHGTTLFMTLLAALQVLLWRYSGDNDVSICAPISLRTRVELEPLLGLFLNNLVLRTRVVSDDDFTALLAAARRTALAAYAHRDLPLGQLVKALNPESVLGQQVLFQVVLVVEHEPSLPALPDLEVRYTELTNGTLRPDFALFFLARLDGELGGRVEYDLDLFDRCTMARMVRHLVTLLTAVVAQPSERVAALPLLSAAERQQLLAEWSGSGEASLAALPATASCVRQLVTAQAMANTRLYVLDCWQRLLPVGVYGELYVSVDGLARGGLAGPRQTAESLVPDPFGERAGGRLYRTSDVVRRLEKGQIEFLGRPAPAA